MGKADDFKPLPKRVQWWRRTRNQRQKAIKALANAGVRAFTQGISVLGATLISFGVHSVYPPAGFVVAGFMCWLLLWSHEQDKRRRK